MGAAVGVVLAVVILLAVMVQRRQSPQAREVLARARSKILALLEEVQAFYALEFRGIGDASILASLRETNESVGGAGQWPLWGRLQGL